MKTDQPIRYYPDTDTMYVELRPRFGWCSASTRKRRKVVGRDAGVKAGQLFRFHS
ncbi:MAG: hypothetical protein RLO51_05170 [Thalassobaculum sp.]|uniref:hypothetical protein n=1 Tax=Thalassobaculum sp. TaxID=2022740 RepID=UPI0032EEFFF9